MFCSSCGDQLLDSSPFCGVCGARVEEADTPQSAKVPSGPAVTQMTTSTPVIQTPAPSPTFSVPTTTPIVQYSSSSPMTRTVSSTNNKMGLRIVILVASAAGVGAFFLPWISLNFGFGSESITGYSLARESGWRSWNPPSPWAILALLGLATVFSLALSLSARGSVFAVLSMIAGLLTCGVVIDYVAKSWSQLSFYGIGFWGCAAMGFVIALLSLIFLAVSSPRQR
jgi:hypothetical protein